MWRAGVYRRESIQLEYTLYDYDNYKYVYADAVAVRQDNEMEIFEVKPGWHLLDKSKDKEGPYLKACAQLDKYVKLACGQRRGQAGEYKASRGRKINGLDDVNDLKNYTIIYDGKLATYYMGLTYRGGIVGYTVYREDKPGRKNAKVGVKIPISIEQAQRDLEPDVIRYVEGKTVEAEQEMYRAMGMAVMGIYAVSAVAIAGTTVAIAGLGSVSIVGTAIITSDSVAIVAGATAVNQAATYVASQGSAIKNTAEAIANHLESTDYTIIVQFGEAFYKLIAAYTTH